MLFVTARLHSRVKYVLARQHLGFVSPLKKKIKKIVVVFSMSVAGNWGHLTWVRHSLIPRAALVIAISVRCVFVFSCFRVFVCPNNGMAASVSDFS